MVEDKVKREWGIKLGGLDVKQSELRKRANELEDEIEQLENELVQNRVKRYRTELAGGLKKCFSRTFRERGNLVESRFGSMERWNLCSRKLRACVIVRDCLDTDEGDVCRNVPDLQRYLRAKLSSELEGNVEGEILDLL